MLKTVRNAFKVEDIRKRLLYTLLMLVVVRFGSQLPTPGVDPTYIQNFFANQTGDSFNFFNAFTGGIYGGILYKNVGVCSEYYTVYHIIHHHAAADDCNSEA